MPVTVTGNVRNSLSASGAFPNLTLHIAITGQDTQDLEQDTNATLANASITSITVGEGTKKNPQTAPTFNIAEDNQYLVFESNATGTVSATLKRRTTGGTWEIVMPKQQVIFG